MGRSEAVRAPIPTVIIPPHNHSHRSGTTDQALPIRHYRSGTTDQALPIRHYRSGIPIIPILDRTWPGRGGRPGANPAGWEDGARERIAAAGWRALSDFPVVGTRAGFGTILLAFGLLRDVDGCGDVRGRRAAAACSRKKLGPEGSICARRNRRMRRGVLPSDPKD